MIVLVLVLVFTALLGLLLVGPPTTPDALACPQTVRDEEALPRPPNPVQAEYPELMTAANELAVRGRLDAAERLYDRALALQPADDRAGLGLAYVQARRALAVDRAEAGVRTASAGHREEAEACFRLALGDDMGNLTARQGLEGLRAPDTRSLAEQLADGWDGFYERWLAPAARAALPFLAALAVLMVLARLLTPVTVPEHAPAWRERWRATAWWVGLGLLTLAALRSTAFSGRGPSAVERWLWPGARVAVVCGLVAVAALVVHASRGGSTRPLLRWSSALVVVTAGLSLFPSVEMPDGAWPWALSAALATLGVVCVAAGRGHALRLQVRVTKGEAADPAGTAYVLARLEDLGSGPPRGLKAPQQVDVQDLPSSALSSLPAGKVAAALTSLVNLVLPSVPWRATVAGGGEPDEVVVTVTRNGSVAETAIVNGARFRPRIGEAAGDGDAGVDPSDLLTAAAAVILTTLADRHPLLRVGLCGATRWQSVAAYVVATKPPETRGGRELRRQLLATAVDVDPANALARLAYLRLLAEESRTAKDFRTDAERLRSLVTCIPEADLQGRRKDAPVEELAGPPLVRDDGWTALRLRTWHALTATWLNLWVAVPPGAPRREYYVEQARQAWIELRWLAFRDYEERNVQDFAIGFRGVVSELREALKLAAAGELRIPDVERDRAEPLGMYALYDRACVAALTRTSRDALEDLRLASGLAEVRTMARTDPWFRKLRRPDEDGRFWDIIGPPAPAFTDLTVFGEQGPRLRALGIRTATDLWAVTSRPGGVTQLASSLAVPRSVVARWHALAELGASQRPGDPEIGTRLLALLLEKGIDSVASLKASIARDEESRSADGHSATASSAPSGGVASGLFRTLTEAAEDEGVRPPSPADVGHLVAKTLA